VKFPGTSCDVSNGGDEDDVVYQPAEMSYVIGRLLAVSAASRGVMARLINPGEVAVAGHSDGGDTAAAVAANTCCIDHRVVAAVVMAGGMWPPLGGSYFPPATPPVLFVQGNADPVHRPSATLAMYRADTTGTRYYVNVLRGGHFSPYEGDGPQEHLVARVTLAFLDRYVAGQGQARAALLRPGHASGVAVLLNGGLAPAG
jgi:predicted dienelactone hydrolase